MKQLLFLLIFVSVPIFGQKYYTKTGVTEFKASVDTFEPIKAINNSTSVILNVTTGDIASLLFVKAFNFRVGLMQEHFNENYMYSSKFPKSTFEGVIQNFNYDKLENNYTNFIIEGEIEIKGVKKNISTVAIIKKTDEGIDLNTNFKIKLSDYDIKIPRLVFKKIDENVKVSLNYSYEKK